MMKHLDQSAELKLLAPAPLLMSESRAEYDAFASAVLEEIQPAGIIGRILVVDLIDIIWQIIRLRRTRTVMVNVAFRAGLCEILSNELRAQTDVIAEHTAQNWFIVKKVKDEVSALLARYNLDEGAIEAQAIRHVAPELARIDAMLASLETRRSRTLRGIADYRDDWARRARNVSERVMAAEDATQAKHCGPQ